MKYTASMFGPALMCVVLMVGASTATVGAQPSTRWPPAATVVATGLNNPRGLSWAPDGGLLIAEAGTGGTGRCFPGVLTEAEMCFGRTGSVTELQQGQQRRIITGLPSLAEKDRGSSAFGPADVASVQGRVLVAIGGPGPLLDRSMLYDRMARDMGTVQAFDRINRRTRLADVAAFESSNDPDGNLQESNTTSLLAQDGEISAIDAAGNAFYRLDAAGGLTVLHVFPDRSAVDADGTTRTVQAVPTALAQGPDGAIYISDLTGSPFPAGAAKIWRWDGRVMTEFAGGFTGVNDLAFGPDGSLYALETFAGQVVRVRPDGERTVVAGPGLTTPTGLTVGPTGALYVTNCGNCAGTGTVVRFTL